MSFPRYYHSMGIPTQGGVETGVECNATMWDVASTNDVEHSYRRYYSGFGASMDTTPEYSGATARQAIWRPYGDQYEIGSDAPLYKGKRFKFTNYIKRADFDALIEWVRTNTIYNHTGSVDIAKDANYAKTDFAMCNIDNNGSFASNGWLVPTITANLSQRQYDEEHDCYLITLSVAFGFGTWHWDGQKWAGSGGYTAYSFNGGVYGELEKVITALNKCYNELGKIYFSMGPYSNSTNFQVGDKYYRRYTSRGKGRSMVWQYDNPLNMGALQQTRLYFTEQTANGSTYWIESGTVDPDDPTETPTPKPPNPDEPDPPPVPPIDPPDIPPSEPIPPAPLPPINASSNGFFTAWNPSIVTLRLIGDKLWSSNIIQQFLNSIFSPMDTILGLGVIPVQPTTQSGDNITVHFGFVDSEVKAPMITSDYVRVDCGSVYLTPYYANYLDYEPYTKMSLFIPYVGEFDLNPDEVTGKTLRILCSVNVLTGDLIATVLANGSVIYQAAGNCMRSLPVTSGDLTQIVQAGVAAAGIIAGAAVGGAALAGAAAGGAGAGATGAAETVTELSTAANSAIGGSAGQPIAGLAGQVMGAKMHYHRAGQMGTGAGQLGNRKPFITILRPNLMLPDGAGDTGQNSDLKAYKGYPCNQIMPLTNASGMTVVEDCRLSIPGATDEEVGEALAIMKGGYIA